MRQWARSPGLRALFYLALLTAYTPAPGFGARQSLGRHLQYRGEREQSRRVLLQGGPAQNSVNISCRFFVMVGFSVC